ncbi:MAG TPA: (2,3-dihydroxybenzoyl)adenylate synthase [Micromonosporaceae bacterium]|nr:(2,3-dihydroxybenzoyl)adenylate synthase [Micromonosporaceae bacterium]
MSAGWPAEFALRYRAAGYWTGETFGAALRRWAGRSGDRVAVVDGHTRLTYRQLDARADRLAAGLHARGIRPGDRVVVQLTNTAAFVEVLFGLWRLGAVPVVALPAHRQAEIGYFCAHTEAVAYVIPDGAEYRALAAAVRVATPTLRHVVVAGQPGADTIALSDVDDDPVALPEPDPSALALLQLSGGSTGVPKLIPRTADDYLYSVRASAEICRLDEDTVYLCALPAAHNFPLSSPGLLGVFEAGGRVVMCPRPDPETAFALIAAEGVTITALVPPLALLWLDTAARTGAAGLETLRVLQVGGAKLGAEAAARVGPVLGCRLQQVFGMAEGLVNYTRLDDPDDIVRHTQGRPISPDDEIRVVDDADVDVPPGEAGHLLTRGPYTIRGYFRADAHNATVFTADGFYRTGDLVRLVDGYLVVTGRAKDQVNRGGEKIAVEEVENHLLAHPGVHDVAVVAMPDPYLGERTCAFVVPPADTPAPTSAQLRAHLRNRGLAAYKLPDKVTVVDAFPVTGVGKVSRSTLRASLRAQFEER